MKSYHEIIKKWQKMWEIWLKNKHIWFKTTIIFLLCTFFCESIFPYWFLMNHCLLQRATRKAHPRAYECIWDNIFAQNKNVVIPLICQYESFIHTCVSKMRLCLKMRFSNSLDIRWYAAGAIYTKNFLFSHLIVFYF